MTGDELAALLEQDEVALLDVRSAEEFEGLAGYPCDPYQGHIPGAVNLDLNELYAAGGDAATLKRFLAERGISEGRRVIAYCHSGSRSELAAALLRAAGVDAVNYEGSWHEWSRRETPR
ncbi:MAG TPA: rhodanese-like domain-containing protein [Gaiellaceae bacterium]|nr:rhodanese-like domain-containing protein [Gaiellaceae bacterium]